jgi:hypothetical protein
MAIAVFHGSNGGGDLSLRRWSGDQERDEEDCQQNKRVQNSPLRVG